MAGVERQDRRQRHAVALLVAVPLIVGVGLGELSRHFGPEERPDPLEVVAEHDCWTGSWWDGVAEGEFPGHVVVTYGPRPDVTYGGRALVRKAMSQFYAYRTYDPPIIVHGWCR